MRSRWVESEAQAAIDHYAKLGVGNDLALRVYTTRLLGQDPQLVLHGGGNTSVKTRVPDLLGEETEVLCVKGSGWDMAAIEPAGLPAVRLAPLRKLRALDALSDEEMVRIQRANLIDPMAPNPSVETLLHAFVPHAFVDHTHANAVLSLTDQPNGADICTEVYDGRMGFVPYLMPGFGLAKKAADVYEAQRDVDGLILHKHGIFTFGASAREAYERMIEMVTLAEERLTRRRNAVFVARTLPERIAAYGEVAPILRGACSLKESTEGAWRRLVLDFRTSSAILNFVNGAELMRYSQAGVITPDHTIRTKNWPLVVPAPEDGKLNDFRRSVQEVARSFVENYQGYFARHNGADRKRRQLDPLPRVILVPGLGLVGLGRSKKDARIAADLAESAVKTITDAEAVGRFESISEFEMFEVEYWSLEQAKLNREAEKPLAGQVAVITGAGGAIGAATARAFADAGAEVALLDVDERAVVAQAKAIGGAALAVKCDVTHRGSVAAAFVRVVEAFGGVDTVVSNAGTAWMGLIGEVD
jgi:rhamnose utilization protein RhaD (predicted bifunctional aldolase and dehydrogenase)